jgi:hypothetical protein
MSSKILAIAAGAAALENIEHGDANRTAHHGLPIDRK